MPEPLSDRDARAQWLGGLPMLPSFEIGMGLWLVEAWELRKIKGADWCERKKVGMVRRALLNPPTVRPEVVLTIAGPQKPADAYTLMRNQLAFHCHKCGECKWSADAS